MKSLITYEELEDIGKKSNNLTGADIENIVNESSYLAIRENLDKIELRHVEKALDQYMQEL